MFVLSLTAVSTIAGLLLSCSVQELVLKWLMNSRPMVGGMISAVIQPCSCYPLFTTCGVGKRLSVYKTIIWVKRRTSVLINDVR